MNLEKEKKKKKTNSNLHLSLLNNLSQILWLRWHTVLFSIFEVFYKKTKQVQMLLTYPESHCFQANKSMFLSIFRVCTTTTTN